MIGRPILTEIIQEDLIKQYNMERIQYIPVLKAMALALCFGLAGCSAEQVLDEAHPIEIEATIPAQTKAGVADLEKKAFANDDLITVSKSGTSAVYKYTNGRWLPNTGTGLSTTGAGETFTASWQPADFDGIQSNQNTADNYQKSYALTAKATASANLVQFRFAPAAAKITIVVTYTTNCSAGSASITGDKLFDETSSNQTINFLPVTNSDKKHTFMGLVCPGKKTYTISVKSTPQNGSEQTKTYSQASKVLEAGHNYTYNFSTDSRSLLILNNVTVTEFATGGTTTVGDAT